MRIATRPGLALRPLVRLWVPLCAAALVFASCGGGGSDESTDAKPVAATDTGQAFAQPARVTAVNGVLHLDLVASDRNIKVAGTSVRGQAYGNDIEGPTLVVSPGDTMDITLDNRLTAHTNLHFHGLHVSPSQNSDNIFLSINPGQKFHYVVKLPKDHAPGTYWYHSHAHTHSEEQVFGGLSGLIIVQGLADRLPPALRNVKDVSFALKDAQVVGGVIPTTNIQSGAQTARVVNSAALPVQSMQPGEVQLWRLANIGADIWYDLQLEHQQFVVIAEDGNPVWEVWTADHLVLPPGKRFDVLVTIPKAGTYPLRTLKYHQGDDTYPKTDLVSVQVAGAAMVTPPLPTSLATAAPIPDRDIVAHRTEVFSENEKNQFFINGKEFDPNRVDVRAQLGTAEEWTLKNTSDEQHPFHIHVNDFQVISIGGKPYAAKGLQDTVALLPGKDVVIRMRFLDFTGRYVFHCHILNHEDNGMMGVLEVVT